MQKAPMRIITIAIINGIIPNTSIALATMRLCRIWIRIVSSESVKINLAAFLIH